MNCIFNSFLFGLNLKKISDKSLLKPEPGKIKKSHWCNANCSKSIMFEPENS